MRDLLVLCYHAVSADWPSQLAVPPSRLDAQLRFLIRRGYRPATLTEALRHPPAGRVLAVTFDDAYRSVIERALPVLERQGVPATVFAPTAYVDEGGGELPAWSALSQWAGTDHEAELRCMSWDDLRTLAAAGWEIGSHSSTHPVLTALGDAELDAELSGSRAACEEAMQQACTSLAYPFGAHDDRVAARAQAAGYEFAAGLDTGLAIAPASLARPGQPADPFALFRLGIYRRDGWPRFLAKVSPAVQRLRASRPAHRLARLA
ncbi:MAG TPA: polysaccharide deacetylase family protein [Solirubrobacterales bacterium]|nr:polysaccharide deacetylase family protein [Solirubrobacterales bacterium]